WVLGFGYYSDDATRYDLDRATGDRPAMVRRGDGHAMLVNSKAIELLGITADTPNPLGGEIVRDENAHPTRHLLETAQAVLGPVLPPETEEERMRLLDLATEAALSAGVTTITNVGGTKDLELFDRARAQGALGVRIYSALWLTESSETAELPE